MTRQEKKKGKRKKSKKKIPMKHTAQKKQRRAKQAGCHLENRGRDLDRATAAERRICSGGSAPV